MTNYKAIKTQIEFGNVFKITLNRPNRKNAFNVDMYHELKSALIEADSNESILFVCITGAGDYFTSGNDLKNYNDSVDTELSFDEIRKKGTDTFNALIETFIEFKKPIVLAINGPAVGLGVSIIGLVDLAFASDKATFHTPFTKLGLVPEACSSFIFPLLMGDLKAKEVLLFNRKLTASEAFDRGLLNAVIPNDKFESEISRKLEEFSKLPKNSLWNSRKLMRLRNINVLKEVNRLEGDYLSNQIGSDEFMEALANFMQIKSKL